MYTLVCSKSKRFVFTWGLVIVTKKSSKNKVGICYGDSGASVMLRKNMKMNVKMNIMNVEVLLTEHGYRTFRATQFVIMGSKVLYPDKIFLRT